MPWHPPEPVPDGWQIEPEPAAVELDDPPPPSAAGYLLLFGMALAVPALGAAAVYLVAVWSMSR